MTQNEINKIITLMKREKSIFVYHKLNYLLFRAIGFPNKEASEFLNVTSVTWNIWFNAWKKGREDSEEKWQGRKSKLTESQLYDLKRTK